MRAFVMAAGHGTRLRPLTNHLPKPALPVANEPLLGRLLRLLARHGYQHVACNASWLSDRLQQVIGDGTAYGVDIHWSIEPEPKGTAGGMKHLEEFLRWGDEPIVVLSGDGLHEVDISAVVRSHRESGAIATMVLSPVEDASQYGVAVVDDSARVTGFQEKPAPGTQLSHLCNTGIYVFQPEIFDEIPAGIEDDFGSRLFPDLVDRGMHVHAVVHEGYWNDIGGLDAYRDGNLAAIDGSVGGRDVDQEDDAGVWPSGVLVHPTATIDPTAIVTGPAIIGAGVHVMAGAAVSRSVLLPGCIVGEDVMAVSGVFGTGSGLVEWASAIGEMP